MKAVILAGGAGERLRPVVDDLPKPMAPINGKPFLEFLLLQLVKWDIREIVLSVGYKKEIIKSYFKDGRDFDVNIEYCDEEEPLGTGGAIKKCAELITDNHFIAMNGDSFLDINFNDLISCHNKTNAVATLGLPSVNNSERYGKVEMDGNGVITKFAEKQSAGSGYINGGVYVINKKLIDVIPDGKVSLENDVLPLFINKNIFGMAVNGYFIDIGVPETYLDLCGSPNKLLTTIKV